MVPGSFTAYFAGAAAAAGALIGLLFVSVSLRPDSVFGEDAPPAGRALAGSAFIGLVNAFFVSLMALVPKIDLGGPTVFLAVAALFSTARLNRRLRHVESQLIVLVLSMVVFVAQLGVGIALVARRHDDTFVYGICYLIVASFGVALSRAWSLLQGRQLRAAPTRPDPAPS